MNIRYEVIVDRFEDASGEPVRKCYSFYSPEKARQAFDLIKLNKNLLQIELQKVIREKDLMASKTIAFKEYTK